MKKIVMILLAILPFSSFVMADELDKAREDVKKIFISEQEPTTKDAVWTSANVFKVGVIDNGTPRDGYAEYVCTVLYDHGFKGKNVLVRVVDINRLIKAGEWVNLGTAYCQ